MPSATGVADLGRECQAFTRYLAGERAAPDVVAAYERAHEVSAVSASGVTQSLDRALLQVAHLGPALVRAADAYASVFARSSLLRRKLVLLVAILESRGESAARLDTADPGSPVAWMLGSCARAAVSLVLVCLAAVFITPLRLWYRLTDSVGA